MRNFTIIPDNDKAGLHYAHDVLQILKHGDCINPEIFINEGHDIADYLDNNPNLTIEELNNFKKIDEFNRLAQSIDIVETNLKLGIDNVINDLAKRSLLEYDKIRKEKAIELGVRTSILDKAVHNKRQSLQASSSPLSIFEEVVPWEEEVNLHFLLNDIVVILKKYAILREVEYTATALWICFTWCFEAAEVSPLLILSSPEKRCGKTTVLELLQRLVRSALATSNLSSAALYRTVTIYQPTLLIDEADTFFNHNPELTGIVNSGHTKTSAFVLRVEGENHIPTRFSTWCPKVIAAIGSLNETIHDRAIIIKLKRKRSDEYTEKLYYNTREEFNILKRKLARFSLDHIELLKSIRIEPLASLSDRASDNWSLLFAIAELARLHQGENIAEDSWVKKAQDAALKLSGAQDNELSTGIILLEDICTIFTSHNVLRIASADLVKELCDDKEKPWANYNTNGSNLTQSQLAKMLGKYGIKSKSIRIGDNTPKGYELAQFEDTFARYLVKTPSEGATAQQARNTAQEGVADILFAG